MSMTTRQIGGIEVSMSTTSTQYRRKLYVPESELSRMMPVIGEKASWTPGNAVITSVTKTWLAPGSWLLVLTAEPVESTGIVWNVNSGNALEQFVEKSFSLSDLYFPEEWFGIRTATVSDTPQFRNNVLSEGETKYQNIANEWAVPGDFIFCNALPRIYGKDNQIVLSETEGSANYRKSPFLSQPEIPLSLVGCHLRVRVYHCTFNTRREPHRIGLFQGVSGSFPRDCTPGGSETGRWKAISQTVRNICTAQGREYTCVHRVMLEAPEQLKWDPDKNGGVWTW